MRFYIALDRKAGEIQISAETCDEMCLITCYNDVKI